MNSSEEQQAAGQESENLFSIVDRLVYQIDRTKKLVVVLIIAVIVSIPVTWHVSSLLPAGTIFRLAGAAGMVLGVLVFLVVGVRQWIFLSNWTRRYKAYKEQQKRIDQSLDFEGPGEGSGNSGT